MVIGNRDFPCLLTNELVFRLTCEVWRHYRVPNTSYCMILCDITCYTTVFSRIPFTDTTWRNHVMQDNTPPEPKSRPTDHNLPACYKTQMLVTLFRRVGLHLMRNKFSTHHPLLVLSYRFQYCTLTYTLDRNYSHSVVRLYIPSYFLSLHAC
jgi:hypothetical protein